MDGILNTGIQFWQLIVGMIVFIFGIIAIRITFTFDINKYLNDKREIYRKKLQNVCTHMNFTVEGDKIKYQLLFESPSGTAMWGCGRCGLIVNNIDKFDDLAEYYAKNPKEFEKNTKRFKKYFKKAGY